MQQDVAIWKSVWDGVYSAAQAARGKQQYDASCASCHGDDLAGREGKSLVGAPFWQSWGEDSLESLYAFMKGAMPHGQAGSLADRQYLDILAYVLQRNDYPEGSDVLTADAVRTIRVMRREGPGPVPDFALVVVVGCISERSRGEFVLTNASEPVRTRRPDASIGPERERSAATARGPRTLQLMNAYQAASNAGRRMEVKGLLIRGAEDRVNVTSMEVISDKCDP